VSKKPQTVKRKFNDLWLSDILRHPNKQNYILLQNQKKLAAARHLTYFRKRSLPYHLYADEIVFFVFAAPLTSVRLSKNLFFDSL